MLSKVTLSVTVTLAVSVASASPCELTSWYESLVCPNCQRPAAAARPARNAHADRVAVEQTVQRYFDGLDRGDTSLLRQAFHPTAVLYFARNDSLVTLTHGAWCARMHPRA